jgi:hypothetical protein
MNGPFALLAARRTALQAHPIDNLDGTILSDTVDIEVNADFEFCPPLDDAG